MAGKIIKVCLLHGKKCYWQSLRYIPRKSQFQIKICRAAFPCSQQYLTSTWELAKTGKCEKADFCPMASEACKLAYNMNTPLPKMRWINCVFGSEMFKYTTKHII